MSSDDVAATTSLTLAGAMRVLEAARSAADEIGKGFCIAVTDRAGAAIVTARMDGAPPMSAGIAADKAYSVCGFNGLPTHRWWDVLKDDPALANGITHTQRVVTFGGGVAIRSGRELVGAIGVSGGTSDEDVSLAEAGAAALSSDAPTGA